MTETKKPSELTNDDLARVLEDARKLMNDNGSHWLQGHFRKKHPKTQEVSYCTVGAIRAATPSRSLRKAAYRALANEISEIWGAPMHRVILWNDRSTWKDVDGALKKAVRRIRSRKTRSPHLP